jgi:hypothetical protein
MKRSRKIMKMKKVDRLIIEILNIAVSALGSALLTQGGFWEGFSTPKTIGATILMAALIFRALKDAQHGLRKGAVENVGKGDGRVRQTKPKNIVQGTPWTKVQFVGYKQVNRDPGDNVAAL